MKHLKIKILALYITLRTIFRPYIIYLQYKIWWMETKKVYFDAKTLLYKRETTLLRKRYNLD